LQEVEKGEGWRTVEKVLQDQEIYINTKWSVSTSAKSFAEENIQSGGWGETPMERNCLVKVKKPSMNT
jgi:hypothetical protein